MKPKTAKWWMEFLEKVDPDAPVLIEGDDGELVAAEWVMRDDLSPEDPRAQQLHGDELVVVKPVSQE